MSLKAKWNRRSFLETLAVIAGVALAPAKLFSLNRSAGTSVTGFGQSGNPYEELGVTTVINGEGTMTMLGGSVLRSELEAVMAQAGRHLVRIPGLEGAAGERDAGMLKLPGCCTAP